MSEILRQPQGLAVVQHVLKRFRFSLRKAKQQLFTYSLLFWKKRKQLDQPELIQNLLHELDQAIKEKDRTTAKKKLERLEQHSKHELKKNAYDYTKELIGAILFVVTVATLIRAMWFENQQVPTGSMRPTIRELDRLIVSKTPFGLNRPLSKDPFFFDPARLERTQIVTFTAEGIDMPGADYYYFGIFPGKKRMVKRLMAKGGDRLYFYGGQIHAVDASGKAVSQLLNSPHLKGLEHIPFIYFGGRQQVVQEGSQGQRWHQIKHFNLALARAQSSRPNHIESSGLLLENYKGSKELLKPWGMDNYSMTRLLFDENNAPYLELNHHPLLSIQSQTIRDLRTPVSVYRSKLPLTKAAYEKLKNSLYTARFVVHRGQALRYDETPSPFNKNSVALKGVPDGTYEFYYGKAYEVGYLGNLTLLPHSHPLYNDELFPVLFNNGLNFNPYFETKQAPIPLLPSRFSYYRDGNLYVMGDLLYSKDDPQLLSFIQNEQNAKRHNSSYLPFLDTGAPSLEQIQKEGILVPEGHVLVLGDNHAGSGDSRDFGFVPETNISGSPLFIYSPWSSLITGMDRPALPLYTPYRAFVWTLFLLSLIAVRKWRVWVVKQVLNHPTQKTLPKKKAST